MNETPITDGNNPNILLVETKQQEHLHPYDVVPQCPLCKKRETGVETWIKGYPKFYCYQCSISFFVLMPRVICSKIKDHPTMNVPSISPYVCRACNKRSMDSETRKCIYSSTFLPFPTEMKEELKKQSIYKREISKHHTLNTIEFGRKIT